jgi:hypothetical protein
MRIVARTPVASVTTSSGTVAWGEHKNDEQTWSSSAEEAISGGQLIRFDEGVADFGGSVGGFSCGLEEIRTKTRRNYKT